MRNTTDHQVRDAEERDAASWTRLYALYRSSNDAPADQELVATAWAWILGRVHGLRGIVAVDTRGEVIALANLRLFARPSVGEMGLYLDDLFTDPSSRGSGAASALLKRAAEIAAAESATVVRWITASDNVSARRLYDAHAAVTTWVTYDMQPNKSRSPRDWTV